ncbi:hypothetical protein BC829DRAFT_158134 [Chytridium lagenaria]|nr:hypothetical protein BC829DRAFT_158134 [Chytridium lagenaria]
MLEQRKSALDVAFAEKLVELAADNKKENDLKQSLASVRKTSDLLALFDILIKTTNENKAMVFNMVSLRRDGTSEIEYMYAKLLWGGVLDLPPNPEESLRIFVIWLPKAMRSHSTFLACTRLKKGQFENAFIYCKKHQMAGMDWRQLKLAISIATAWESKRIRARLLNISKGQLLQVLFHSQHFLIISL